MTQPKIVNVQDTVDEFHKNCGELLRWNISLENELDYFLTKYFCRRESKLPWGMYLDHEHVFMNDCLSELDLNGKKTILSKIIMAEELIDERERKTLIRSITELQEIRNKVAHFESRFSIPEGFILQNRGTIKWPKNEIKLNGDFVKEYSDKIIRIKSTLIKLLDRIEKKPILNAF